MPDDVKPVFLIFFVVTVASIVGGFMAADRGRKVFIWCLLCALLPPLLLVLFFSRPLCEVEGMYRKCAECGQLIKWRERVCKHCKAVQTV